MSATSMTVPVARLSPRALSPTPVATCATALFADQLSVVGSRSTRESRHFHAGATRSSAPHPPGPSQTHGDPRDGAIPRDEPSRARAAPARAPLARDVRPECLLESQQQTCVFAAPLVPKPVSGHSAPVTRRPVARPTRAAPALVPRPGPRPIASGLTNGNQRGGDVLLAVRMQGQGEGCTLRHAVRDMERGARRGKNAVSSPTELWEMHCHRADGGAAHGSAASGWSS
eukprot:COSAG06_NODE_910_length_11598_cov_583.165580_6_plen_229_part_00